MPVTASAPVVPIQTAESDGPSAAAGPPSTAVAQAARRAQALLWVAFGFFVAGVGLGTAWDRRWHATHPFEDFYSPPHLFIYGCVLLTVGTVAVIAFSPGLRRRFGADEVRWRRIGWGVPGPLLLLGCGLGSLGLAGVLDGIWHTTFGLDETGWSLPHALLGHGILLTFWGFAACRLALRPARPLSWPGRLLLGWTLLATATDLLGGPLIRNLSPRALRAIAALPVLAADPRAQHTYRIYLAWHIDRTNPLFLPLAAFSVGFGLALVRWLAAAGRLPAGPGPVNALGQEPGPAGRWASWESWMLAPAAAILLVALISNRQLGVGRFWEPLPYALAALAFVAARRFGVTPRWAWIVAGVATCLWLLVFVPRPLLAVLAGALALPGAWAGAQVARIVDRPSPRAVLALTGVVAGTIPVLTGALDLYLRTHTP